MVSCSDDGIGVNAATVDERLGALGALPESRSQRGLFGRGLRDVWLAQGGGRIQGIRDGRAVESWFFPATGDEASVQLTASYQLEITDGDQVHPLRRFSGGEQDLAGLCLRLALSRALARQRGAETGFVLLDEVFGSQDADRRRALLEQLHAIADSEFRQVFVISHTDDVVEHCDLRIDVTRVEDRTSVAAGPRR